MTKSFLLFILVSFSGFLTVKGQDTLKDGRIGPHRPTLKEFLNPRLRQQQHARIDSLSFALNPEKKHPTIYLDFGVGGSYSGVTGVQGNYSLNYQYQRSLFTFRGVYISTLEVLGSAYKGSYYYNPYNSDTYFGQYALMYGWRFTNHYNLGVSFSAGISYDHFYYYHYVYQLPQQRVNVYNAGIPFEVNWQFYLRRFGPSFGLKLSGDIAQHGFFGFGVDMGIGFHNTPK